MRNQSNRVMIGQAEKKKTTLEINDPSRRMIIENAVRSTAVVCFFSKFSYNQLAKMCRLLEKLNAIFSIIHREK